MARAPTLRVVCCRVVSAPCSGTSSLLSTRAVDAMVLYLPTNSPFSVVLQATTPTISSAASSPLVSPGSGGGSSAAGPIVGAVFGVVVGFAVAGVMARTIWRSFFGRGADKARRAVGQPWKSGEDDVPNSTSVTNPFHSAGPMLPADTAAASAIIGFTPSAPRLFVNQRLSSDRPGVSGAVPMYIPEPPPPPSSSALPRRASASRNTMKMRVQRMTLDE